MSGVGCKKLALFGIIVLAVLKPIDSRYPQQHRCDSSRLGSAACGSVRSPTPQGAAGCAAAAACAIPDARPATSDRAYFSNVVEKTIAEMVPRFKSSNLGRLFGNCLPNTLDTTVHKGASADDAFIITGDIEAMWLRDSTNQVMPYVSMVTDDTSLRTLLMGVIHRQVQCVLTDAYANAFTLHSTDRSPHEDDRTWSPAFAGTHHMGYKPGVFERKYELDSLANVLLLSGRFYSETKQTDPFNDDWVDAVKRIIEVIQIQRQEVPGSGMPNYSFQREALNPTDTLSHGEMWPNRHTGLIRSAFRPSDDATTFPYLIPANALAVVALRSVSAVLLAIREETLHTTCLQIATDVEEAIYKHGVVTHHSGSKVFAYEVDGFGNHLFMDDANLPSLLSFPVFGFVNATDATYQATRTLVLSSETNPYYFSGPAGAGVGGPHNGINFIWPMSIITQAWTASKDEEILSHLDTLVNSSACTGLMHESFHVDSVFSFTRPWFAWANSFFGDLILKIAKERPHLIYKN